MRRLVHEKEKAIELRKKGLSYNEILKQVPVAKSTLSTWLKNAPLTKNEKSALKNRINTNISKGRIRAASELRKRRLEREKVWLNDAKKLFNKFKEEPLFHAGIAMYWAEGAKTSNRWMIINTDLDVILLMLMWLDRFTGVYRDNIRFRLFIHRSYDNGTHEKWWVEKLNVSPDCFLKTVYKDTKHKSKQKSGHQGCLRIEVNNSKGLMFTMKVLKGFAVDYYRKQ